MSPADWAPLLGAAAAIITGYVALRRASATQRKVDVSDAAELRRVQAARDDATWGRMDAMFKATEDTLDDVRAEAAHLRTENAELRRSQAALLEALDAREKRIEGLVRQLDDLQRQLAAVGREMPGHHDPSQRTRHDD